jgi:sterol desaturase/sphingolipid hydroxylase (fatty acid hydroxylase superfamily)
MAWWNGPVLILLFALPSLLPSALLGRWSVSAGALCATAMYYVLYEYIHWCMHLPKSRRLEQSALFRRLNGHHLLHHRYMHKNFNVVMPLADLVMGTLILEARTRFAQPVNPAVPNVQPNRFAPLQPLENEEALEMEPHPTAELSS